ncbi:hypothetical protein [Roseibium limicola]|uniref:Uncharacterized protein n=1 Tax=Roseibium limicola TaxID=2816037 RepID=A0A939J8W6_9HYPH|nr:hypothetical protein [Roseibium limicola]MBO0345294.1 hypothetical protein [Roseibium limicola]
MASGTIEIGMKASKDTGQSILGFEWDSGWDEVRKDPWALTAGATGLALAAFLLAAHACCFGFQSDVIQTFGVICSGVS